MLPIDGFVEFVVCAVALFATIELEPIAAYAVIMATATARTLAIAVFLLFISLCDDAAKYLMDWKKLTGIDECYIFT